MRGRGAHESARVCQRTESALCAPPGPRRQPQRARAITRVCTQHALESSTNTSSYANNVIACCEMRLGIAATYDFVSVVADDGKRGERRDVTVHGGQHVLRYTRWQNGGRQNARETITTIRVPCAVSKRRTAWSLRHHSPASGRDDGGDDDCGDKRLEHCHRYAHRSSGVYKMRSPPAT